ncbi:MAG: hypothetical protein R2722_10255 [Tessaracoccus sp.]
MIDACSAAEFESMHIRGSYNAAAAALRARMSGRPGWAAAVLVCPASGPQARQRLGGAGIAPLTS